MTKELLLQIIKEELEVVLDEKRKKKKRRRAERPRRRRGLTMVGCQKLDGDRGQIFTHTRAG